MPNRSSKPKRPRDVNELAHAIGRIATGEQADEQPEDSRNPAAVELGRRGGLKGGKARAAKMTPEQRSEAAKRAALARWSRQQ